MNAAMTTTTVNGLRLLEACGYDRRLCAVLIATRDDWQEVLDSIPTPELRRPVAATVFEIRASFGLPADHALDVVQGTK